MKARLRRVYWILKSQFGFDPKQTLKGLIALPKYLSDLRKFRSGYTGALEYLPCLHDWHDEAGLTKSEYFWQDLLVARMVREAVPQLHVDIGSRLDGFVAHLACFREVEVFDVRPITQTIPGIIFTQADLMQVENVPSEYCDSLSCLHALEHFGLGRYGDSVNPRGFEMGLRNMARLLKHGGTLYLSIPIGAERVEFNGQRVSNPHTVVRICEENNLKLTSLTTISREGDVKAAEVTQTRLLELAQRSYSLGVFVFTKQKSYNPLLGEVI